MKFLSQISEQDGIVARAVTLTDATTISVNCDTTDVGTVTLGGNRTMGAPSGTPTDGQRLTIRVIQDGTGGRTLAWNSKYFFSGSNSLFLSPAPSAPTTFDFQYRAANDRWYHTHSYNNWGFARGILARNERDDTVTGIPSDGVGTILLSTSGFVFADRAYLVVGHGEFEADNVVPTNMEAHIKYTTTGLEPTAGAANLTRQVVNMTEIDSAYTVHMAGLYFPTTSHTLYVAMHAQGVKHATHVYSFYSEFTPSYITIEDIGPRVGASGGTP